MRTLKHIGKIKNTGAKVLVAFRTLPGEAHQALVFPTANLPDAYHDAAMALVESEQAQESYELGELLHVRMFPDGRPMLRALQADGWLTKVPTDHVIMTPTPKDTIPLDQLNVLIAEQKNCAVDDLPYFVAGAPKKDSSAEVKEIASAKDISEKPAPVRAQASTTDVLSDKDIAKSLRSQADALYKEAARLRKEADELDPIVKKSSKAKDTADA